MTEMNGKMKIQDEHISFIDMFSILWKNKKNIIIWGIIGALFGLMVGFSLPKIYQTKVTFAPETEQKFGSGVGSIASMMGVNLDNSIDAISVDMFPDVIASTPFLFDLFYLPVETKDGLKTDLLCYLKDHQKKPWWSHVLGAPFKFLGWIFGLDKEDENVELVLTNLPKEERGAIKYLRENIAVELDKKTGKAELSICMQDPLVAATVLNAVVNNLKNYMSEYRTSKDRQDIENLESICAQRKQEYYDAQKAYADFADRNKNLALLRAQAEQLKLQQEMNLAYQVYSQVATQLEGARIKEQQSKPVFVILEPVLIPLRKTSPSKLKLLVGYGFLSALLAAVWLLWGKTYYEELKKSL